MNRKKLLPLAVLAGVVLLLAAALLAVTLLNRRQDGEESGIALFSVSAGEVTALARAYLDGGGDRERGELALRLALEALEG